MVYINFPRSAKSHLIRHHGSINSVSRSCILLRHKSDCEKAGVSSGDIGSLFASSDSAVKACAGRTFSCSEASPLEASWHAGVELRGDLHSGLVKQHAQYCGRSTGSPRGVQIGRVEAGWPMFHGGCPPHRTAEMTWSAIASEFGGTETGPSTAAA